jgi:hypothetical protein
MVAIEIQSSQAIFVKKACQIHFEKKKRTVAIEIITNNKFLLK